MGDFRQTNIKNICFFLTVFLIMFSLNHAMANQGSEENHIGDYDSFHDSFDENNPHHSRESQYERDSESLVQQQILLDSSDAISDLNSVFRRHGRSRGRLKQFPIPMYDEVYRGNRHKGQRCRDSRGEDDRSCYSVIGLKRLLRQHYSLERDDLSKFEIRRVEVLAKSRRGKGIIKLVAGEMDLSESIVDGNPYDWETAADYTFYKTQLFNNSDSQGRWQLLLKGHIKVRKIVVEVRRKRGDERDRDRRWWDGATYWENMGSKKIATSLLKQGATSFYIGRSRIVRLRITCSRKKVRIQSAYVVIDGLKRDISDSLSGRCNKNQTKVASVYSRGHLEHLVLDAVTPRLTGRRGRITVEAEIAH